MRRTFLLLILFIAPEVRADVVEDLCRSQIRDVQLAREQSQHPGTTVQSFEKAQSADPVKRYLFDVGVRACVAEHAKADFAKGEELQRYCPALSTPYSLACFTNWLAKQRIASSREIALFADVASAAGEKDAKLPQLNKRVLAVMMLEALVIPTEKYAASHGALPSTGKDQILEPFRQAEEEFFTAAKSKILIGVEERLTTLSSTRGPAAQSDSEAWLRGKLSDLKARIAKLK
jgi:hypothetical protein